MNRTTHLTITLGIEIKVQVALKTRQHGEAKALSEQNVTLHGGYNTFPIGQPKSTRYNVMNIM